MPQPIDERVNDLNPGEERTPSGNGQPQNNAPESNTEADALGTEIDEYLSKGTLKDEDLEKLGTENVNEEDDTVVLPRKQVEAMKNDLGNYRTGLVSTKKKLAPFLKKQSENPPAQPPAQPPEPPKAPTGDEPMKRSEFLRSVQKQAISVAEKDSFVDKHWKEIVPFYVPRHGQDTVEGVVSDIEDAKTLFLKNNPNLQKEAEELAQQMKAAAAGADQGAPSGGGGQGGNQQERRHILPRQTSVQDWYPKKKQE